MVVHDRGSPQFGSTFDDMLCLICLQLHSLEIEIGPLDLTASEPSPGAGGFASPAINILCHKAEEHLLKVLHDKQINRICFGTCEPEWSLSIAEAMFLLLSHFGIEPHSEGGEKETC